MKNPRIEDQNKVNPNFRSKNSRNTINSFDGFDIILKIQVKLRMIGGSLID